MTSTQEGLRFSEITRTAAQIRVLDAALKLISEHGVSGTSLQMIADEMGVTKAAVYRQFKTKEEIVIAITEREMSRLEDALEAAEAEGHPLRAREVLLDRMVEQAIHRRGDFSVPHVRPHHYPSASPLSTNRFSGPAGSWARCAPSKGSPPRRCRRLPAPGRARTSDVRDAGRARTAGLLPPLERDVEEAVTTIEQLRVGRDPEVPAAENPAKELAMWLGDLAVCWGAEGMRRRRGHALEDPDEREREGRGLARRDVRARSQRSGGLGHRR